MHWRMWNIKTDSMINCIKIGNTMCSLYWKKTSSSLSTLEQKSFTTTIGISDIKTEITMRWLCWKLSCCHCVALIARINLLDMQWLWIQEWIISLNLSRDIEKWIGEAISDKENSGTHFNKIIEVSEINR